MLQSHKAVKEKKEGVCLLAAHRRSACRWDWRTGFVICLMVFMYIILSFFDNATWCPSHAKCIFSQVMGGTLCRAAAFGEEELSNVFRMSRSNTWNSGCRKVARLNPWIENSTQPYSYKHRENNSKPTRFCTLKLPKLRHDITTRDNTKNAMNM